MPRRTFKYRLYPNRRQREKMQATLAVCRELNNAALQERREAWSSHRKGMLRRAVEATPRHQSRPRGRSCGSQSSSARCAAPNRQGCIVEPEPLPANDQAVGLDVGLLSFVTRSDGRRIGNPRLFPKAQKRLRRAQRRVARREKFSKRWKKAVRLVARIHRKVFNQRNDFQHKLSRKIVNSYGIIFVEDLNVKGLSRGRLAKSVHDAGWAAFFRKLRTRPKAPGEGSRPSILVERAKRYPSGEANPKRLSDRGHVCLHCGLVTTRDQAAAMEVLRLGLSLQPLTAVQECCG